MLSYPSAITLSTRTLNHLADLIRAHRQARRSRWRKLDAGRQALLVLAHLRNGDTYTRLAAGFGMGVATLWRYIREAVDLLAATAPDLATAMRRIRHLVYVILDGTLVPIDRLRGAKDRAHYSGKHKRHGVNVQVIADPAGRLVWASPALPGSTHDLTAARHHGVIDALTEADLWAYADLAYQGAAPNIVVPFRRRPRRLSRNQRAVNRNRARNRAPGERAVATLKTWKILTQLRCCPRRTTTIVQAILVLHDTETGRHPRWRVGSWRGGVIMAVGPAAFKFARFPVGMSHCRDRGLALLRFQFPPVKPCMRFSRTRLTDVVHRRHSACPARACRPWVVRRFRRG
jgi:hypothetical protein